MKQAEENPSKSVTEKGEIHQSDPSAQRQEAAEPSNVSDPLVTEHTSDEKAGPSASPSRVGFKKDEEKDVEHSTQPE